MKFIFGIIILIITLIIVNDNMLSFQQSKEDFKIDYQIAEKEFNSKITSQNNELNNNENKIVLKESINNESKDSKDDFDYSFDKFEKEFNKKWKKF